MTPKQLATVLAALRYWQNEMLSGDFQPDGLHFETETPLTVKEIDELCEELNS